MVLVATGDSGEDAVAGFLGCFIVLFLWLVGVGFRFNSQEPAKSYIIGAPFGLGRKLLSRDLLLIRP